MFCTMYVVMLLIKVIPTKHAFGHQSAIKENLTQLLPFIEMVATVDEMGLM